MFLSWKKFLYPDGGILLEISVCWTPSTGGKGRLSSGNKTLEILPAVY